VEVTGYPYALSARSWGIGGWAVVTLTGEFDVSTMAIAQAELNRAEREARLILIDLRAVSFMDSRGLAIVIGAANRLRRRGGRLVVAQGPPEVQRIFELTHATEVVDMIEDPSEILAHDPAVGLFPRHAIPPRHPQ
jgi:anti-anti-sigma factor